MQSAPADHAKRGTRALLVASALHALVLVALMVTPRRQKTAPASAPQDAPLVVSVEGMVDDETPHRGAETAARSAERAPPALEPRSREPAPGERPPSRDDPSTAVTEPAPGPLSPDSLSPPVAPVATTRVVPPEIGLALGAPNAFASGGAREQPASAGPAPDGRPLRSLAETKRAVESALREPARQRERELGLGPEGPLLQALGDATSASTAPVKGRAVFRAVADGTGMIVGIEVVDCDGGRPGWANAAELARRALQGRRLRMPSSAARAEMRIEVVSEWKMPSGHDPGTDVSVLGVPVAKGEGKKSTKLDILDPIPKIEMVEIAPDVKVPVPRVTLPIVAVQGDPVDLGARPRRVVHTKLLDSKVL